MNNIILIFTLTIATVFSQSGDDELKNGGRIDLYKPTVYLDYVCQDKKNVYLRMKNNTVWHINVLTEDLYFPTKTPIQLRNGVHTYAMPNDKDISLGYTVERDELSGSKKVAIPKPIDRYARKGAWITPRDSILFSVPIESLREGLKVSVAFNYEWEITRGGYTINDPEHKVFYRGIAFSNVKPLVCQEQ